MAGLNSQLTMFPEKTSTDGLNVVRLLKRKVFMANQRVTVREFAKVLGLKKTGADYIGTTVLLKLLCKRGLAKKVDSVHVGKTTKGRKCDVFVVRKSVVAKLAAAA